MSAGRKTAVMVAAGMAAVQVVYAAWVRPQPRPPAYTEGLWGFLLRELPGGRTRLVISGYQVARPRWMERFTNYWLYIPVVWPMQARMLAVLKRNIEQAARTRQAAPSGRTA